MPQNAGPTEANAGGPPEAPGPNGGTGAAPPVPSAPKGLLWRVVVPCLKVLVAGGLLYYVLATKVDETAKQELQRLFLASPQLLALAVAAYSAQILIGAQRLRMLLAAQGVRLSYLTLVRLAYVGAFFDPIMVTSVGGDAIKAVYLARETPRGQRVESVSVLVLDRLFGLLGLMTVTLVMALLYLRTLSANPQVRPHLVWLFVIPFLLLLGTAMLLSERVYRFLVGAVTFLSDKFARFRPFQFLLRRLPVGAALGSLGTVVNRAYYSLQKYRDRPRVLLAAWGLSLVVHVVGVAAGYVLGLGMSTQPGFGPFVVAWLISNFICSFAPFAGIGVGQVVYDPIFLHIAGLPRGWVLATAAQATCILAKLPGLAAWLVSREQPSGPAGVQAGDRQAEAGARR